jgi:hypothetical protein
VDATEPCELLIELSRQLRRESETGTAPSAIGVKAWGERPLIISAAHATPHIRRGRLKSAESKTGAIALHLGSILGGVSILPLLPQDDDPNFDLLETGLYKSTLASLLSEDSVLVDIHGMRDGSGVDLCIGTGGIEPIPANLLPLCNSLISSFAKVGMSAKIDYPFDASHPGTIAAFGRSRCRTSIQLELSVSSRNPPQLGLTFDALVAALSE